MTHWLLIWRSLVYHARSHLGVVLGSIVAAAALTGALIVGDSVRESLVRMGLLRLGRVEFALQSGDRFFREGLDRALKTDLFMDTAAVLQLPGTASTPDGPVRANHVQVLGVDPAFWKLALQTPGVTGIPADSIVLSQTLADQLQVKSPGKTVVVRVKKPSHLSREATLATKGDAEVALRAKVIRIVRDEEFGRFSLRANQIPPANAFVNLAQLQTLTQMTNRANLMLVGAREKPPGTLTSAAPILNGALAVHWGLADAEAELRPVPNQNSVELISSRIFLDAPLAQAALATTPDAQPVLTYLVNLIQAGEKSTPYSMVSALALDPMLRDDEILINTWLAGDLGVQSGATIALSYFLADSGSRLIEVTNQFRVKAVVPMQLPFADRSLMPEFPGIAKAESAHDWDAGFTLVHKIRPEDDLYWKNWRGTPKAFVTLAAGQRMWANRYGTTTAIRFPIPAGKSAKNYTTELEGRILKQLRPESLGLRFEPVREQALNAAQNSQDFAGLFIGFSFFLITAALILVALLFRFSIEQRAAEAGTLLALGFKPKTVVRLFLLEGLMLSFIGSAVGSLAGIAYAKLMLHGLTTIWSAAISAASLQYHAKPATLLIGLLASTGMATFSIWLVLRKLKRQPARELLAGALPAPMARARKRDGWIAGLSFLGALAMVGYSLAARNLNPGLFFGAGSLLLISGLAGISRLMAGREQATDDVPSAGARFSLVSLGLSGVTRRHGRSLAVISLLACGSFLVAAIGAFRLDATRDATRRDSGTGGFALLGESSLPILKDLNTREGREFYNLPESDLQRVAFVPFRVRDGDEASCLNLNRAQRPRILGVNSALLAQRRAFSFAGTMVPKAGWESLRRAFYTNQTVALAPDEIPAIGDATSIQYALGKKIGDTLEIQDERGKPVKLRLVAGVAASILQGNLLIEEAEFLRLFPSEAGYRLLLVDAPPEQGASVAALLSRAFQDVGAEWVPPPKRLAQFNAVQNTYLGTFQLLGGLGLLLGSAGLGVVVLRNVLERRNELALLLAVGFTRKKILRLVLLEHLPLLAAGLGVGVLAAAIAVLPALLATDSQLPYATLLPTLAGIALSGLVWTWLSATLSLRGNLLNALRNE